MYFLFFRKHLNGILDCQRIVSLKRKNNINVFILWF